MKLKVGSRRAVTSKSILSLVFNETAKSGRYLNWIPRPVFQEVAYEEETYIALTQNTTYDTTAMR